MIKILYIHTAESLDDMLAYIKSALTVSSLSVPILDGRLSLEMRNKFKISFILNRINFYSCKIKTILNLGVLL